MGFKGHIIEMDDRVWAVSGSHARAIEKFESISGDKKIIIDFPSSLTRVMTVDAPVKYAETMVTRKLQEEGEFDESVTVLTHWKRKQGPKTTDIFFTAVGTHTYTRFMDRIREHGDTVLVFPLYRVLYHFIKKLGSKSCKAAIFRHDRYADLLIGTAGRIHAASRCTAFDVSHDQVQSLWDMVSSDILAAEEELQLTVEEIFVINWADAPATLPEPEDDQVFSKKSCQMVTQEPVVFQEGTRPVSFLKLVQMIPVFSSMASRLDLMLYGLRKTAYTAAMLFFIATVALFWLYHKYDIEAQQLEQKVAASLDRIGRQNEILAVQPVNPEIKPVLEFVKKLNTSRYTPSYAAIFSDVEHGMFEPAVIQNIKINYTTTNVKTEIYGTVDSGFDMAYKGYQALLKALETKGYTIDDSRFNTLINRSEFRLVFSRSLP